MAVEAADDMAGVFEVVADDDEDTSGVRVSLPEALPVCECVGEEVAVIEAEAEGEGDADVDHEP